MHLGWNMPGRFRHCDLRHYPNHDISTLGGFPSVYSCDLSRGTSSLQNALLSDLQKRFGTLLTKNITMCLGSQSSKTIKQILNNYIPCQVAAGGSGGRQVTEEEVRRVMSQAIVRQVGSSFHNVSSYCEHGRILKNCSFHIRGALHLLL